MCDQTEINYLDGEIVWVKLGSCWWPGEVVGSDKLPPDLLPSFRKPPIAVVKFFQEDSYEYVKNLNSIYKYDCSRKNEFINKGLYMYRTKHGLMEKFPEDVIRAETAVGGDITILTRDEFQEMKKESYAGLFGDPRKLSAKKGKSRPSESSKLTSPIIKIKEKTNYKVHILLQGSKTPNQSMECISTPSTSRAGSEPLETLEKTPDNKTNEIENQNQQLISVPSTPTMSSSGQYACHACQFTTTRLNVLILHNKTHSVTYMPYIPTPIKKQSVHKTPKSTPVSSKVPKQRKPRQDKHEKLKKKSQSQKRPAEPEAFPVIKKPKTDEEIKSSLLADWDDGDEESNDDSSAMISARSPEVPVAAESPAVPTPAELPSPQIPEETQLLAEKKGDDSNNTEKPESSNDSKYEFCEDEDWPVEADIGRKIPRVKNPSRKSETKSVSLEDDEMAREVADLLTKTTVPELPTAPEPLKVEENFPEPSIVKSPDKQLQKPQFQTLPEKKNLNDAYFQPKTIFKTKTFFRSRHSRSQDAIGKYVAEQLNAAERMDMSETELNGSDLSSQHEMMRISSPVEHVKGARLAPKIQLKKMKAEAAQLREKEKHNADKCKDDYTLNIYNTKLEKSFANVADETEEKENSMSPSTNEITPDILCNKKHNRHDEDNSNIDFPILDNSEIEVIPNNEYGDAEIRHNDKKSLIQDTQNEKKLEDDDNSVAKICTENNLTKSYEPFMNESTASAVDALLSVSRETDRVTKVISDDPPEDLFEEDIKDNSNVNGLNDKTNDDENTNLNSIHNDIECNNVQPSEYDNNSISHEVNKSSITILEDNTNATETTSVQEENVINTNSAEVASSNITSSLTTDDVRTDFILEDRNTAYSLETTPSESDLQIAEALITLPTTTMQSKASLNSQENNKLVSKQELSTHTNETSFQDISEHNVIEDNRNSSSSPLHSDNHTATNSDNMNSRFETEQEQSENLSAAKSLVQMSESIDHKIKIADIDQPNTKEVSSILKCKEEEVKITNEQNTRINSESDKKIIISTNDCIKDPCHTDINRKSREFDSNSSKLLKILEEPCKAKATPIKKTITKQVIVPSNEKILNFEVGKPSLKHKSQSPKQKIIIRRTTPNKNILNNISEVTTPDKIILSRTNKPTQDGSPVQTYTIQTTQDSPPSGDGNTIIIQQKIRKITKPMSKLQKVKPPIHTSSVTAVTEKITVQDNKNKEDAMFDISSMPVVLSEDILTPENIEKMPIVMSDGNVISNSNNPPKLIKTKPTLVENEKTGVSVVSQKSEIKTLLMNSTNEVSKVTTPNILSKSSKLRGAKPMLVIDKVTGKQKIVMTKTEPTVKEIKPPQTIQSSPQSTSKTEKFIILPTPSSPRSGKTQKIVIDPQTGKAHVLVGKSTESSLNVADNKPVSAKLIPSASDTTTPGNTVMIITNAQGAQSRIVLTPEHEKILFPNKQSNLSQLKTVTHRITSSTSPVQKTISTTHPINNQTRIVPKQKSAIITSKGQLIVGGRITSATPNIAPLPEIRPAPKRILASEPKKLVQTIQKNSSEPLIFLQQKSGAVMQLTAAQFEHLRRTGQIIQKAPQDKIVVQKSITLSPNETVATAVSKQRIRKQASDSPIPSKKVKHEIAIAPAPASITSIPALTPLSNTISPPIIQNMPGAHNSASATNYSELDNIEELLPSTAIARQDSRSLQPELATVQPPPASLSDGQLLAVPGEHFGGPSGSFYLCVEENGRFTVIDNRPLVLENNQLVPMAEPLPVLAQPERRDILEAALANSDVFHAGTVRDDAPDFRDLNANVSVHCRVSETSSTLNQPIMTPVEVPTKGDSEPNVPSNLEDGLAVIGVTPLTVPTSLELPITVTDPRIAPKTTDPLSSNNYGTALLPSPNTEMTFSTMEQTDVSVVGPISMPLLTEEESVGKSMPILTDEVTERTTSSVESTIGSPSSIDVRESENEDSSQWPRRLLTPCSDTSETSAEIPLQPVMQLSVNDMSHDS